MSRPTIVGVRADRVRQNASLRTTTFERWQSSEGRNVRPSNRSDAERVENSGGYPLARNGFGSAVRRVHHHAANIRA